MNSCENPIVLTDGDVRFRLDTDAVPGWCDGWMTLSAAGTLPVPDTLPGDRLILPIDEGIALPVDTPVEPTRAICAPMSFASRPPSAKRSCASPRKRFPRRASSWPAALNRP